MSSADNKIFTIEEALRIFKSAVTRLTGSTKISYKKAVSSFECFCLENEHRQVPLSEETIARWYFHMRRDGASSKTTQFYLNILSGLYKKTREEKTDTVFKPLRSRIAKIDLDAALPDFSRKIESLLSPSSHADSEKNFTKDLIIFSLARADFDFSETSQLRKENLSLLPSPLKEIGARYLSPGRKYVFPLDQTKFTKRQLQESISSRVAEYLKTEGFPVKISAEDTLKNIWASIALDSGLSPHAVLSIVSSPPSLLSLLAICSPLPLSSAQKEELLGKLLVRFKAETPCWYAMQLRKGVKIEELQSRLARYSSFCRKSPFKTYYPVEEITRKTGRRIFREEKPLIGNIVFFRTYPQEVYPLFRDIWDIAWCYRDKSTPGNPYAIIRDTEMEIFRKAIGFISPEFEVAPTGEMTLQPGDRVVIIDGQFSDMTARVLKQETSPSSSGAVVYRLLLSDTSGKWSLSLDARLLRPVS